MMVGIIDLGTNTFNILITEIKDDGHRIIYRKKYPVKLGQGGIDNNFIQPEAFQRGIEALIHYQEVLQAYRVEKIYATATSAIRSATNGNQFIEEAKKQANIDIEIISGEREAELIYKGAITALPKYDYPLLFMDIGGGSTEFIIADNQTIYWKQSFFLGVSRLIETFKPSDPIKIIEIDTIEQYFDQKLTPLFDAIKKYPTSHLIGTSGSFDSYADVLFNMKDIEDAKKEETYFDFQMEDIHLLSNLFIQKNLPERLKIEGLIPMRADMIVMSAVLIEYIIEKLGIKQITLSKYALKEGILAEISEKMKSA
jgi:exopolyphosphatase / guanosine-5'-triphosphate,3'-diphosphate pyrophosphatase